MITGAAAPAVRARAIFGVRITEAVAATGMRSIRMTETAPNGSRCAQERENGLNPRHQKDGENKVERNEEGYLPETFRTRRPMLKRLSHFASSARILGASGVGRPFLAALRNAILYRTSRHK